MTLTEMINVSILYTVRLKNKSRENISILLFDKLRWAITIVTYLMTFMQFRPAFLALYKA